MAEYSTCILFRGCVIKTRTTMSVGNVIALTSVTIPDLTVNKTTLSPDDGSISSLFTKEFSKLLCNV